MPFSLKNAHSTFEKKLLLVHVVELLGQFLRSIGNVAQVLSLKLATPTSMVVTKNGTTTTTTTKGPSGTDRPGSVRPVFPPEDSALSDGRPALPVNDGV